jgi:hypothetical protein
MGMASGFGFLKRTFDVMDWKEADKILSVMRAAVWIFSVLI